jgi:hypothetical protein
LIPVVRLAYQHKASFPGMQGFFLHTPTRRKSH